MSSITYLQGSLFDAPQEAILTHACNTKGQMNSGIAFAFKSLMFSAFRNYEAYCLKHGVAWSVRSPLVGRSFLTSDDKGRQMLCLFTSDAYGKGVDRPELIITQTISSIEHFMNSDYVKSHAVPISIHSNKFNSGLFRVPWSETENIINSALANHPNLQWTVWEM